jgi:putative sterol carrier protein
VTITFGSEEWIAAWKEEVNESEAYAKAAADWEGDFYFIVMPEGAFTETIYYYVDLWHGKCREAYRSPDGTEKDPEFRLTAPISVWRQVVEGKLDAIQGMLAGKLKVKGNLIKITRYVRAAQELVACCARVETEFPPA